MFVILRLLIMLVLAASRLLPIASSEEENITDLMENSTKDRLQRTNITTNTNMSHQDVQNRTEINFLNSSMESVTVCVHLPGEDEQYCVETSPVRVKVTKTGGEVILDYERKPTYMSRRFGNVSFVKFYGKEEEKLKANNLIFDREDQVRAYAVKSRTGDVKDAVLDLMRRGYVNKLELLVNILGETEGAERHHQALLPFFISASRLLKHQKKLSETGDLNVPKHFKNVHDRQKRSHKSRHWENCRWLGLSVPGNSDCFGMCGRGCSCWRFVCGTCCTHQGCWEHDKCCDVDFFSFACLFPFGFSCYGYSQYPGCLPRSSNSGSGSGSGCFPGEATVIAIQGMKTISKLSIGETILAYDSGSRKIMFSEVISFLDNQPNIAAQFIQIGMENGHMLSLSSKHLVFKSNINSISEEVFASKIKVGDHLITFESANESIRTIKVINISYDFKYGLYAPLTTSGNLFVNGVLVSCYALMENQVIAHSSMAPLRWWLQLFPEQQIQHGWHWYARGIYNFSKLFMKI